MAGHGIRKAVADQPVARRRWRVHAAASRGTLGSAMPCPPLARVRRTFDASRVDDVAAAVRSELERVLPGLPSGAPIAIAVGSRGISDIRTVVAETVRALKSRSAAPFIVPAMGSHGGATAEGQRQILAGYGITEEAVGAPVRSSMEVVRLPGAGPPIFMDRLAWRSHGVILVNRVKPHTDYHGFPESGLMKMAVIGLGKHAQALAVHAQGAGGLATMIAPAARRIFASGKILAGLAVVENAYDRICVVRAALPRDIETVERSLLAEAVARKPELPVSEIDVLVVDEMGKDVSGVGLDTTVIGRMRAAGVEEPRSPAIGVIVVTDLTEASHGNALGVGLADIVTRRLQRKIDPAATKENAVTSTFLERAKVPLVAETDREALEIALRCCRPAPGTEPRIVRIRNTLRLDELHVSRPVLAEMRAAGPVEELGAFRDPLDASGSLVPFGDAATR
jgi:hypothetical protein